MLIIEITKKEFPGSHIGIKLFIVINILFIEIEKIELTGGHIEIMLYREMEKLELIGSIRK